MEFELWILDSWSENGQYDHSNIFGCVPRACGDQEITRIGIGSSNNLKFRSIKQFYSPPNQISTLLCALIMCSATNIAANKIKMCNNIKIMTVHHTMVLFQ